MKKTVRYIFLAAWIATLVFIWGNSYQPAATSGNMSGNITKAVNDVLKNAGIDFIEVTEHFIRKSAHAFEFAVSSFCISMFFFASGKKARQFAVYSLFMGLLTACTDEFIQNFVEGRSSKVADVFIDFFGTICGLAIAILTGILIKRFKERKQNR